MSSTARIILVGNLGRNPESRYTPNGTQNVQFTMAVNPRPGQRNANPNWYRVTLWGNLAQTALKLVEGGHLVKGKQVFVDGRFEVRDYIDSTGKNRYSLDVNADALTLLGSPANGTTPAPRVPTDEELPFEEYAEHALA